MEMICAVGHLLLCHEGYRTRLIVVPEDEDRDAAAQRDEPLDQHLCELLCVLFREGVEEVPAQEVEKHAAGQVWRVTPAIIRSSERNAHG